MKLKIIICSLFLLCLLMPVKASSSAEQKLTNVIKEYVVAKHPKWQGLTIQVSYKFASKIFAGIEALGDKVNLKISETYQEIKPVGNVIFPIEIQANNTTKKVFLRAKVVVFKDVVVAKNKIKRGQAFSALNLELEERDIAMLPQKYFESIVSLENQETKTSIPAGSIVFEWMTKKIPLVRRGESVTIYVSAKNLLVKTSGVVLEDGYLNRAIKVRGVRSKEILDGFLVATDEVKVSLK